MLHTKNSVEPVYLAVYFFCFFLFVCHLSMCSQIQCQIKCE